MKRLLIILLLFASCKSTKDIGLVGKWIGEYGVEINLSTNNENTDTLSYDAGELIERLSDSSYYMIPGVIDFLPNGDYFIVGGNKKTKGDWILENGTVIVNLDTFKLFGKPTDTNLTLESQNDSTKIILNFQRQNVTNALSKTKEEFFGKFWKIKQNDSIIATYHFKDSSRVIINSEYGAGTGLWNSFYYKGIFCLTVFDLVQTKQTTIYIVDFDSGLSYTSQELRSIKPKLYKTIAKEVAILTKEQQTEIKTGLFGNWVSSDFYPQSDYEKEELRDLKFELLLNDTTFSINYSGIGNESQKKYKKELNGSWEIAQTGEYIILKYKMTDGSTEHEIVNYMSVNLAKSNELIIDFSLESLTNKVLGFGQQKINLERK